jgi:protein involved in polysaccharide export with SLBB domain
MTKTARLETLHAVGPIDRSETVSFGSEHGRVPAADTPLKTGDRLEVLPFHDPKFQGVTP